MLQLPGDSADQKKALQARLSLLHLGEQLLRVEELLLETASVAPILRFASFSTILPLKEHVGPTLLRLQRLGSWVEGLVDDFRVRD